MTRKQSDTTSQYTRRRFLATTAAVGTVGIATTQPTAATDDFAGVFGTELAVDVDYVAGIRGYFRRLRTVGPQPTAETLAERARNEFDSNQAAWVRYGNWLLAEYGGSPVGTATIAVDFRLTRRQWPTGTGHTETTLDIDFDDAGDRVDSVTWSLDSASDPDHRTEIRDGAAVAAADELQRFRRLWIDEDGDDHEFPDDAYLSEVVFRHAPDVVFGSDEQPILEVLLGEVRT